MMNGTVKIIKCEKYKQNLFLFDVCDIRIHEPMGIFILHPCFHNLSHKSTNASRITDTCMIVILLD